MRKKSFKDNLKYGQIGQDVVLNYLERDWNFSFVSGERKSVIQNMEFVEEVEGCKYLFPIPGIRPPSLEFVIDGKKDVVTLPDLFVSHDFYDKFFWIEAKRQEGYSPWLNIGEHSFDSYEKMYRYTRNEFKVSLIFYPYEKDLSVFDIYSVDMGKLIRNKKDARFGYYRWSVKRTMDRMNKKHLVFEDYI